MFELMNQSFAPGGLRSSLVETDPRFALLLLFSSKILELVRLIKASQSLLKEHYDAPALQLAFLLIFKGWLV